MTTDGPVDPLSALLLKRKDQTVREERPREVKTSISEIFDVASALGQRTDIGETATDRIRHALSATSNVNFPIVTDICERVLAEPSEAAGAVEFLVNTLCDQQAHFRRKLKAITIAHELMYDEHASEQFRRTRGAEAALRELKVVRNTGLGESSDEHIRMFATEMERTCFPPVDVVMEPQDVRREKARLLMQEVNSSVSTNLNLAPPRGDVQVGKKRELAFDLWKDASSAVQANLVAVGSAVHTNLEKGVKAIDLAIDEKFKESATGESVSHPLQRPSTRRSQPPPAVNILTSNTS